jgi:hypothetical protein
MKNLFAFLILFQFQCLPSIAKITPGRDTINDVPATWTFDLFDELAKHFPHIQSRKVYYLVIENNQVFKNQEESKSLFDAKIFIERGSSKSDFTVAGQQAKLEDKITLNYNQKLKVYIPELEKIVVIGAANGGKRLRLAPFEITGLDKPIYKKILNQAKEIPFKESKKPIASESEDEEKLVGAKK